MLFREKWMHHLSIVTQLDAIKLQYKYGNLKEEDVAKQIGKILTEYAVKLPIVEQEQAPREPGVAQRLLNGSNLTIHGRQEQVEHGKVHQ